MSKSSEMAEVLAGRPTPQAFMAMAPSPPGSNTIWGSEYGLTLRKVVIEHAAHAPRTLQKQLGPSEIGAPCDRQVVGKLASQSRTNHIVDPWASIVGTAIHKWLAEAFEGDNERSNYARWLAEFRVHPHEDHPGTGDLYDFWEQAVTDHKGLGTTTLDELRKDGPTVRYFIQLLAYARGFRLMGLPVRRIVLVAWPRTRSRLDKMYVWDHELTPDDDPVLDEVFERMKIRKILADLVIAGRLTFKDIPPTPDDRECYFCPFFRADVLHNPSAFGCAGHHLLPGRGGSE
jgi:hypothetical protein